ncbi:hypothetical protein HZS_444 [Henneguya salminicola]|nr:hypothetical protein HZS_444 [Henneguya salminicola]
MSSDACKISKSIQKKIKFKHAKNIYTGGCQPKISVLLHGMVQTLNEISDIQIPTMLLPDDFKSYVKMSVNFRNVVRFYDCFNNNRPGFPSTYKLKLYLPLVFKSLRSKFNVSEQQFYDCFLSEPKQSQHSTNFYKSSDRIFNLRFLENDDVSAFIAMIERYYNHIVMNNNNTFLPMYVGLCRILVDGKYIYVIIMKNSLYFPNTETISRQFFSVFTFK